MPSLLELGYELIIINILLGKDNTQNVMDTGHHTLETTEVHDCAIL